MTSYKRVALSVVAVLLLSLPMFGQYTTTYSLAGADVLNSTYSPSSSYDCVQASCWVQLGSKLFIQLSVSQDSEVQAIDSSGYRWRWNLSTASWNEITGESLSGLFKEIHVGSYTNGNYLAITTQTSGGNVYYWNGSAWTHLGTNWECSTGSMDALGDIYCIGTQGNTYQWTTNGWVLIRDGDGATISNNSKGVALLVNTSGNLYAYNGSGTSWTQITGLGFTPSTLPGSTAVGEDNSVTVLGSAGNIRVSRDGSTFTEVNNGSAASWQSVANPSYGNTFALSGGGLVYHLNTVVPLTSMSISGTCGSACGSGDPGLSIGFVANNGSSYVNCPSGWVYWIQGGQSCGITNAFANTVLNSTAASAFMTVCDSFAPGTQCTSPSTINVVLLVKIAATGALVYQATNSGDYIPRLIWTNQKYKITSSTTGPATQLEVLGWPIPQTYFWNNVSVTQWCTLGLLAPNLAPTTTIDYVLAGPTVPQSMPGAYVNVDIESLDWPDGTITAIPWLDHGTNWKTSIGQGHSFIYTWNNNSAKRGPGGSPTVDCSGEPLQ